MDAQLYTARELGLFRLRTGKWLPFSRLQRLWL